MESTGVLARWQRAWVAWMLGAVALLFASYAGARVWHSVGYVDYASPPLAGRLIAGGAFDLSARPETELVYFWASWCPVCRRQKDVVESLRRDHAIVTVATRSGEAEAVHAHLAHSGLSWPVLNDPDGDLAGTWRTLGVPRLYVLDRHGRVRFSVYGYTSELGLRARMWIARHL